MSTPTHPFEDEDAPYLVVVNDLHEHALWPAGLTVPAGWRTTFGPRDRSSCLEHVDRAWSGP